jgi:hypothetical protein
MLRVFWGGPPLLPGDKSFASSSLAAFNAAKFVQTKDLWLK